MNRKVNYECHPSLHLNMEGTYSWQGWPSIVKEIKEAIDKQRAENEKFVLCIDDYPGTDRNELLENLIRPLKPETMINILDAKKPESRIHEMLAYHLSDDRVFGSMSTHKLADFFDPEKLEELEEKLKKSKGLTIIYGEGAALLKNADLTIYCDLTRWEIQLRYRKGLDNWEAGNYDEDILRKFKRGYFVEWRVFDRHKFQTLKDTKFILETNTRNLPAMMTKSAFEKAMDLFASSPFRLVPYFDGGIWGGDWMEENFGLKHQNVNYAWAFDGVPEENGICVEVNGIPMDLPAMDLVKLRPKQLLGKKVYSRFGAEFPIRFDFLDTMHGGNLSLQVHPLTEYIKEKFGMSYTQDESYYILDASSDSHVYLGVKEGVNSEELIQNLKSANRTGERFEDEKFINCFPVKKHDHVLIPAGTIHASGSGTVVLEISATPYIFTFKLYDWQRVGLDGKPRPINIDHGAANIQYDRNTDWCKDNLLNNIQVIHEEDDYKEEITGLHELEFIETRRAWFNKPQTFETEGSVNVLNLVEGEAIRVEPKDSSIEPIMVHYAETFIIPESVKEYRIVPIDTGSHDRVGVVCARVRV